MNKDIQLQLFKDFIVSCTVNAKSVKNYSDFKRINECLALLFPDKQDVSILDFDDAIEFEKIVKELEKQKEYIEINVKGKNQYSTTVGWYQRFLNAKSLFSKYELPVSLKNECLAFPLQTIYYGAPGTGKSYKVKSEKLPGVAEENIFRATFHPDYDYASFVGCYKPKKEGEKITYSFLPQVFTNAYVKAWNEMKNEEPKQVYLVIEEINRGNCAQIFGDLFQLLDRGDDGKSEYPVDADEDLKNYLRNAVDDNGISVLINKEGINGGKLCLPPNINILATMNTSDQSLFPMDSAFKRRWEWEYVPIRYTEAEAKDVNDNFHTFKITIGSNTYKWVDFLAKVNEKILAVTDSEDKQMGEYFIKKDIDEKTFINKVMYYLWSEVCKDNYKTNLNLFFTDDGTEFSFNELFTGKATALLVGFMKKLQVKSEEEKKKENSTENFKANDDVSSTED